MLTYIVFIPLAGALILGLIPREKELLIRRLAVIFSLIPVFLLLLVWMQSVRMEVEPDTQELFLAEVTPWLPEFGISYSLGLDGISLPLVSLVALMSTMALVVGPEREMSWQRFSVCTLLGEGSVLGAYMAQDYVLFLLCWAASAIFPYYFFVAGSKAFSFSLARRYLALALLSTALLGGSILTLYSATGSESFALSEIRAAAGTGLGPLQQWWILLVFFIAFALRIPLFPFHTWLPRSLAILPLGAGILLLGGLLPLGIYALFQLALTVLPDASRAASYPLAIVGTIDLLYCSLAVIAQEDRRQAPGYFSAAQMGLILLGMATLSTRATTGGIYGLIATSLTSALSLFLPRTVRPTQAARVDGNGVEQHTPAVRYPQVTALLGFTAAAQMKIPGLAGFVAFFLLITGTFPLFPVLAAMAVFSLVLTATDRARWLNRFLQDTQKAGNGRPDETRTFSPGLTWREWAASLTLAALILGLGVYPLPLLRLMEPFISQLLTPLN